MDTVFAVHKFMIRDEDGITSLVSIGVEPVAFEDHSDAVGYLKEYGFEWHEDKKLYIRVGAFVGPEAAMIIQLHVELSKEKKDEEVRSQTM